MPQKGTQKGKTAKSSKTTRPAERHPRKRRYPKIRYFTEPWPNTKCYLCLSMGRFRPAVTQIMIAVRHRLADDEPYHLCEMHQNLSDQGLIDSINDARGIFARNRS